MEQKFIKIGDVDVPIIVDNGQEWFPVSYITTKILLRSGKSVLLNKNNKDKISNYLRKYIVRFSNVNVQETNCINKIGLIELLSNTHAARLEPDQRKSQNHLHQYLGIILLPEDEIDSRKYKQQWLNDVDDYTKVIIENELEKENVKWIRLCLKCNCHYPLTSRFFAIDKRADKGYDKTCKVCIGKKNNFRHQDNAMNLIMKVEKTLINSINQDQIMPLYYAYREGKIKRLPDCYENKESYLEIIKCLYNKGDVSENNLTIEYIINNCGLKGITKYLQIEDIYSHLFGEDFYLFVWKYPNFRFKHIEFNFDIGKHIISNYIREHNLIIDDIYTYDYPSLIKKCRIKTNDILSMVVHYYNFQYAGYLFKTKSKNYYKDESKLLFDLKYLVEQDMKIDIEKIPLYLTKYTLQKKALPIYHYIISKKNGSLYEWFNKLYPNKFTLHDFELNGYRNEFDSDKEMMINELLNENFNNVIYNQKHTERTIKLDEMIPDWLIITESGVWIVEYFGLYVERQYGKSSRVTDYIDKTKRKIERYKEMSGYKFIFLYPEDIEDDYRGCRDVIAKMKENPYMTMV